MPARRTAVSRRSPGRPPGPARRAPAAAPAVTPLEVEVTDRQRRLAIDPGWLERVACRALDRAAVPRATLGIVLVDDRAIARLHRRWLGMPGATDVITFDLGTGSDGLHGDIVVSTETAARAARAAGWPARNEVAWYVVHGLLHLLGCDDHAPADRRRMRARERTLLAAAGLPAPPPAPRPRTTP